MDAMIRAFGTSLRGKPIQFIYHLSYVLSHAIVRSSSSTAPHALPCMPYTACKVCRLRLHERLDAGRPLPNHGRGNLNRGLANVCNRDEEG